MKALNKSQALAVAELAFRSMTLDLHSRLSDVHCMRLRGYTSLQDESLVFARRAAQTIRISIPEEPGDEREWCLAVLRKWNRRWWDQFPRKDRQGEPIPQRRLYPAASQSAEEVAMRDWLGWCAGVVKIHLLTRLDSGAWRYVVETPGHPLYEVGRISGVGAKPDVELRCGRLETALSIATEKGRL